MSLLGGRFRIGANFWSRHAGPRTWSRVDAAALAAELVQARAIGLDLLRVFAFVPDFVAADGAILPAPLAALRGFAALAHERGIALLPSALVGHMSGENFDLPGSGAVLSDPAQIELAAALVAAVTEALADQPAVIGWALSNEAPLWAGVHEGRKLEPAAVIAWVDRMIAAVRARSALPIGLGDGQMGGFPNAALASRLDFVAPHVYYGDPDALRQGLRFDHALALGARYGRPLLLEEFGGSSSQVGEREQAALWSEALFAAFTRGAHAALGWCWSDFPVETVGLELPYEHHGFELGFGLTRADGSEKPVCETIRAWRSLVAALPDAPPIPAPARATIVHSSWLDRDYPFSWTDRGQADRAELTAFALAGQAGLQPSISDEAALGDAQLLLVPATQRLLTSSWLALEARAHAGATVYWSYFGGDHSFHQGTWCPIFERLTGCSHRLRYGCFDLPPELLVVDGVLAGLPPLPTGAALAELAPASARIPILAGPGVLVLSRDQHGNPLLVEHALGRGRVIFCAAPLERYAARLADGTSRGLCALYRVLAARAGLPDLVGLAQHAIADSERVSVASLSVGDRALTCVMNRSWQAARLPASLAGRPRWSYAPLGEVAGALGPKQAAVFDAG